MQPSYLVGCEAKGVAAVVDPDRDVQRYIDAAQRRGMQITHIVETHLHADHVMLKDESAPFVLDVRERWEFNQGHVPGAVNAPWGSCPVAWPSLTPRRR